MLYRLSRTIKTQTISKLLVSSLLLLCYATPALAGYVPSRGAPRTPTGSTGRRGGCTTQGGASLTALAPLSHVGQTTSSHPTLAWFVPDGQILPIEFYLYELGENGHRSLVQQANLQSTPGIMSLPLSANQPGLEIGKRYYWQVVLLCNPNYPSSAAVAGAEIERITLASSLNNDLATANSLPQQAELYAEASLWYDAMSTAIKTSSDTTITELLKSLAEVEAQAETSEIEHLGEPKQSSRLNHVIAFEKQSR